MKGGYVLGHDSGPSATRTAMLKNMLAVLLYTAAWALGVYNKYGNPDFWFGLFVSSRYHQHKVGDIRIGHKKLSSI